ncbi:MAG: 4Fe-4S binding protein [Bacteroidales bacterium]|nr:4Fe-4S binding protein [Bacteroidales bacterium]
MLRTLRIVLAALFFAGITLLLAGIGSHWWGWMAELQFLPSCLALNLAVIICILLLTVLFGRIYCSVICPMGVFQDIVIWLRRQLGLLLHKINERRFRRYASAKKAGEDVSKPSTLKDEVKHFSFNKERKWVRYPILVLTIAAIIAGMQVVVAMIAPYSAYGRMVHSAVGLGKGESLAPALLIVAAVTFVAIVLCAWLWGRAYCNTVCPVGTLLGLVGKHPLMHIKIDESKCAACGRCGRGCKSSCIDMDAHTVDYSRCVDCFDCIGRCKEGAITYGFGKTKAKAETCPAAPENTDNGRRQFMMTAALIGGAALTAKAQEAHLDGGLADIMPKTNPSRTERLVPFGAESVDNFYSKCTACQLCVSNCPNHVLRPSTDLKHLLQPEMGYENGFCRPECTVCSEICPSGAIKPVTREQKVATHIGRATVNLDLCISALGQDSCGNCSARCPVGAIRMVNDPNSGRRIPAVSEEICIGCGACEFLCPSRPISAITVNGLAVHHE